MTGRDHKSTLYLKMIRRPIYHWSKTCTYANDINATTLKRFNSGFIKIFGGSAIIVPHHCISNVKLAQQSSKTFNYQGYGFDIQLIRFFFTANIVLAEHVLVKFVHTLAHKKRREPLFVILFLLSPLFRYQDQWFWFDNLPLFLEPYYMFSFHR